jgi:hypothetical protein
MLITVKLILAKNKNEKKNTEPFSANMNLSLIGQYIIFVTNLKYCSDFFFFFVI